MKQTTINFFRGSTPFNLSSAVMAIAMLAFLIGVVSLDQYCLRVLDHPGGLIGCGPALSGN